MTTTLKDQINAIRKARALWDMKHQDPQISAGLNDAASTLAGLKLILSDGNQNPQAFFDDLKKLLGVVLLACFFCACTKPVQPEPRFCFQCYEQNSASWQRGAIVGEGFTTYCDKTPAQIDSIEVHWVRLVADTVRLEHSVTCTRKDGR